MQAVGTSKDLDFAILAFEKLLNTHDSEFVLDVIRKFKKNRALDDCTLHELRHRLSR